MPGFLGMTATIQYYVTPVVCIAAGLCRRAEIKHPATRMSFADSGAHLRNMAFYNFTRAC